MANPEETLRELVLKSGRSVQAVANATGIPQPCLWRFVHRKQTLSFPSVMKLMKWGNLRLVKDDVK